MAAGDASRTICQPALSARPTAGLGYSRCVRGLALVVERTARGGERMQVSVSSPAREVIGDQAQLDCVTVGVLRLDADGVVTHANAAWRRFCRENQEHALSHVTVGKQFFDVLNSSGDAGAALIANGIADVVQGHSLSFDEVYRCHVSRQWRWFRLQARRTQELEPTTVITQIDVTRERLAEARSRIQACVAESFVARKPLVSSCRELACVACDELGWDFMSIWILDSSSWRLRCVDVWYRQQLELSAFEATLRTVRLDPGKGLPGRAWETRKPIWVTDRDTDPSFTSDSMGREHTIIPPSALQLGFHSGFAIPVKYDDDVLAVIEVFGLMRHEPDAVLLHLLEVSSVQLATSELRERAEQRAEAAQSEADAAREQLETVLDCAPALVIAIDRDGAIRFVNRALPNRSKEDMVGASFREYVPKSAQARVERALAIVWDSGEPQTLELSVTAADGGKKWFTNYLAPLRSGSLITGALLVSQDVTLMKQAELDLYSAQRLASIGTLAAGIAHEINTPIQFLGDSIDFLRDASRDVFALLGELCKLRDAVERDAPPELQALAAHSRATEEQVDLEYLHMNVPKAFDRCGDGLQRVSTIVRSMKEFSHPSRDEMEPVDLNRAISATLTVARNEYKYVAELETDFAELPPVVCHVNDINQVVLNIVVNAAHAIADAQRGRDRKGVVSVRTRLEGETVVIAISDTGTGIPEHIRDHIFDPFFTTKEVGRGTGQGLAIAWTAVKEKHGGELTFETEVGKGTTFYIRLPIVGKR
jgi:PAS domain S-box-containing protein